jgi:hypothetical protein
MINVNAIFSHRDKRTLGPCYNVVLENLQEERERMKHLDSFFFFDCEFLFFLINYEYTIYRSVSIVTVMITVLEIGLGPNSTQKLAQELRFTFNLINDPSP